MLLGFQRTATGETLATVCLSSASDFPMTSLVIAEVPVTLAPGRAKLATSPAPTGSATLTITIGIVLVVFLAANDACVTTETMMSTLSWTNSVPGRKSVFNDDVLPLDIPKLSQPALEFVVVGQWPGRGRAW